MRTRAFIKHCGLMLSSTELTFSMIMSCVYKPPRIDQVIITVKNNSKENFI